jgi:hypothetical protein
MIFVLSAAYDLGRAVSSSQAETTESLATRSTDSSLSRAAEHRGWNFHPLEVQRPERLHPPDCNIACKAHTVAGKMALCASQPPWQSLQATVLLAQSTSASRTKAAQCNMCALACYPCTMTSSTQQECIGCVITSSANDTIWQLAHGDATKWRDW